MVPGLVSMRSPAQKLVHPKTSLARGSKIMAAAVDGVPSACVSGRVDLHGVLAVGSGLPVADTSIAHRLAVHRFDFVASVAYKLVILLGASCTRTMGGEIGRSATNVSGMCVLAARWSSCRCVRHSCAFDPKARTEGVGCSWASDMEIPAYLFRQFSPAL